MWLRTPSFWNKKDSITSYLLAPVAHVYKGLRYLPNYLAHSVSVGCPVICIGNVTAGGAGKTPVAIAVGTLLQSQGKKVAFLSRGYGGKIIGPHLVNPDVDAPQEVGDEPLLLARCAPSWIARNRVAGANAAIAAGADIIIMDDGFQNPSLKKDMSLLVIDGQYGVGNGRMLPAGPLREPLEKALQRADAVVVIGEDRQGIKARVAGFHPVFTALLTPPKTMLRPEGKLLAFAGIGNPGKFFATLELMGCQLAATQSFPDHYPYSAKDIATLLRKAHALHATPITTEKDWVRIPKELRKQISYLPVQIVWGDEAGIMALFSNSIV